MSKEKKIIIKGTEITIRDIVEYEKITKKHICLLVSLLGNVTSYVLNIKTHNCQYEFSFQKEEEIDNVIDNITKLEAERKKKLKRGRKITSLRDVF